MESIGKLREYANVKWEPWNESRERLLVMLDEIEREIAERYMLLPVDADGVPIHFGDILEFEAYDEQRTGRVCNMEFRRGTWLVNCGAWANPKNTRHVKQHTIEDVLKEFGDWYKHVAGGCDEPGIIAKYAEELRSMGVDND